MTKFIQQICRGDEYRAAHIHLMMKAWAAYLGLILLGGLIFGSFVAWQSRAYVDDLNLAHEKRIVNIKKQFSDEAQRQQDINRQLLIIIQQRLPAIAEQAADAAKTAKAAANTARGAATTAGGAGKIAKDASINAKEAANTAKTAADNLNDALADPPPPSQSFYPDTGG